jgi:hypothetical protein
LCGAGTTERADWNRTGRLADVLRWFADWKFDWRDIPHLLTTTFEGVVALNARAPYFP